MAQFPNMFPVEMNQGPASVSINQVYQGNHKANRVGAIVTKDGAPLSLGGACAGTVLRADGSTVPLTGVISGNQAYVELESACYAIEGSLQVFVTWISGSLQTTLLAAVGTVHITSTGAIIQPGTPIPNIEQLLAQIEAMREATADAETASAFIRAMDCEIPAEFVSGNITNAGNTTSTNSRIRSAEAVLIKPGMWWTVGGGYEASVAIYSGASFTTENFVAFVGGSTSAFYTGEIPIPAEYIGKYMGIRIQKIGYTSEDISGDVPTVGNSVKLYDPATVLTEKTYEEKYGDERMMLLPDRRASSFTWNFGMRINVNGTETASVQSAITELLPVKENSAIQNRTPALDASGRIFNVIVAEYKNGIFFDRVPVSSGETMITKYGVDGVKLMAVYPTEVTATMSTANLMTNFVVGMVGNIIPGDGQRPVYAAIGASTTVGAIHHYTGEDTTYTPYAYPDYIGQILGMDTYNLGRGTTGFMARNNGTRPNFMDVLYNNAAILKTADLITLTFGYGNDQAAGLPFGAWDDYFPYDTEAQFFVSGQTDANQAGVTTMLSHGATLMGCLNWCIKWAGEHYPRATLICIWGAPSENNNSVVSVISNSASGAGTSGVAPNKITVTKGGLNAYTEAVKTLHEKLNIPIINLVEDDLPFSYYAGRTMENGQYVLFSTTGTAQSPTWNSHPSDEGYLMYARFLAGRISHYFKH